MGLLSCLVFPLYLSLLWSLITVFGDFPTTLEGPFKPVTFPFDNESFHGNAIDLSDTDPQVRRTVQDFEPEQVSVSLSSDYDSVWISWITGTSFVIPILFPFILFCFLLIISFVVW